MKYLSAIAAIYFASTGFALGECPAVPNRDGEIAAIYERLQAAQDEKAGKRIGDELWQIWTDAPDEHAQALLDQGMARRDAYDFAGALEYFDDLIAYCPHYAEGWNQRAFIYFLRADYGSALTDLEKALEIDPDHVAAMSGQALTLLNLGRTETGQSILKKALELNPWLPERAYLIEIPGQKA